MRKSLLHWGAAIGIAVAFSSCAYDPYYASSGGYYGSSGYGYGDGYGYGGSGFSTSVFVSTGNSRWGYDPYCYSYYDYNRRCYYDPYLNGYYPVGYRPPVLVGCPHPYGWSPGRGHCPPPRSIRNSTVVNYRNREASYRNLNHSWARSVRSDVNHHSNRSIPNQRETFNPQHQTPRNGETWQKEGFRNSKVPSGNRNATLPNSYNQPVVAPGNRSFQGQIPSTSRNIETRRSSGFNTAPQGGFTTSSNRGDRGNRSSFAPARNERSNIPVPSRPERGSDRGSDRGSSNRENESSKHERKEGFR